MDASPADVKSWSSSVANNVHACKTSDDSASRPSLEAEVTRLGADPAVLTISSKRVVTQKNFTIPRTTLLVFEMGGSFFLEAGASVMIEGEMKAPKFTIFQGPAAGSVRFGCCPGLVTEAYPQWWGSQTDGVTDDTAAIQAALDSFLLDIVGPRNVYLPSVRRFC